MAALIDYPQRYFELWGYTPSFNQLLLQGNPSRSPDSGGIRIDVIFWSVIFLQLPAEFMGLTMDYAPPEEIETICRASSYASLSRHHVYHLRGKEYDGYIVAEGYEVDEHTRPFYEPSRWDLPKGPKGIASVTQEDLSAFLLEGLIPLDMPARYWTELGQRYGTWLRNRSLFAEDPGEALKQFLEGVKDGYTQDTPGSDSHR